MRDSTVIGERIRFLRNQNNKTQRDICSAVNIEQVTLSQYETSKRIPKLEILISLAQYFKVSLDYLVGIVDNIDMVKPQLTENEESYVKKFQELNQFNQEIIVGKTNELIREQRLEEKNSLLEVDSKDAG